MQILLNLVLLPLSPLWACIGSCLALLSIFQRVKTRFSCDKFVCVNQIQAPFAWNGSSIQKSADSSGFFFRSWCVDIPWQPHGLLWDHAQDPKIGKRRGESTQSVICNGRWKHASFDRVGIHIIGVGSASTWSRIQPAQENMQITPSGCSPHKTDSQTPHLQRISEQNLSPLFSQYPSKSCTPCAFMSPIPTFGWLVSHPISISSKWVGSWCVLSLLFWTVTFTESKLNNLKKV